MCYIVILMGFQTSSINYGLIPKRIRTAGSGVPISGTVTNHRRNCGCIKSDCSKTHDVTVYGVVSVSNRPCLLVISKIFGFNLAPRETPRILSRGLVPDLLNKYQKVCPGTKSPGHSLLFTYATLNK